MAGSLLNYQKCLLFMQPRQKTVRQFLKTLHAEQPRAPASSPCVIPKADENVCPPKPRTHQFIVVSFTTVREAEATQMSVGRWTDGHSAMHHAVESGPSIGRKDGQMHVPRRGRSLKSWWRARRQVSGDHTFTMKCRELGKSREMEVD